MGIPKTTLEDMFEQTIKDALWLENVTLSEGWARELAIDLAWHVRNRQQHVDSYRAEIL
jgi:hypothetical protein